MGTRGDYSLALERSEQLDPAFCTTLRAIGVIQRLTARGAAGMRQAKDKRWGHAEEIGGVCYKRIQTKEFSLCHAKNMRPRPPCT